MSSAAVDLKKAHLAYTRLSERFRTLWTFHHFLQGVHRSLFDDEPVYKIAFAPLYEEIKRIRETKSYEPAEKSLEQMALLDAQLATAQATLAEDDRKIPPHALRKVVEGMRTEDERLIISILKFYFYERELSSDALDKVDFLLTRIGTRRLVDGTRELRAPEELQELSSAFLSLTGREESDPREVKSLVGVLEILRKDLEACERFEDLSKNKTLENIRTLKHRMGRAFYSPEVMSAVLASNVAAKQKWKILYREEERRILQASQHLLEMEKDFEEDPRFQAEEFHVDLQRFKKEKEEFKRQGEERGVRSRDVTNLKEAINRLMSRIEPGTGLDVGEREGAPDAALRTPRPLSGSTAWRAESDALTGPAANRILQSVDLVDGALPVRKGENEVVTRLKLEPWEVRSTLRILKRERPTGEAITPEERLFFNAAVLRLRMDEEAQRLRVLLEDLGEHTAAPETLVPSGRCLVRAYEIDRQFRRVFTGATEPEGRNQLTRSRFRHLRSFAGLWLLYNALGGE